MKSFKEIIEESKRIDEEMEEIYGVEELPLDYEDFENYIEEYEKQTERDLKNDL